MMSELLAQSCYLCVTPHFEYLVRGDECVAVRDRCSGKWLDDHYALDERVILGRRRGPDGKARWTLRICSFDSLIRVGPLLQVQRATPQIEAAAGARPSLRPAQLGAASTTLSAV